MKALLIIDVQNDFLPGGALAVNGGNKIIPVINQAMDSFSLVIATKDYHPKGHISFATTHHKKIYDEIQVGENRFQKLWPEHCLQKSWGAEFPLDLNSEKINKTFFKGQKLSCDSYSAFFDQNREESTGICDYLKLHHIKTLYIAGIAAEYCVKYTAIDAINLGYEVYLIKDAIAFIDPSQATSYFNELFLNNIKAIDSHQLIGY